MSRLCNQIVDAYSSDRECGRPATHLLFGHADAPICDTCIAEYRANLNSRGERMWPEEELRLAPLP